MESADSIPNGSRRLTPRRLWPGTRAVIGGLLVTSAGLAVVVAHSRAGADAEERFVVARSDIAPGTLLTADHLGLQPMSLPASLADRSYAEDAADDVLGGIAVRALGAHELVSRSSVSLDSGRRGGHEISMELERHRAVNGRISTGDTVDVIATSTGSEPTRVLLRNVLVVELDSADEILGARRIVVTISAGSVDDAVALADAAERGGITLIKGPVP